MTFVKLIKPFSTKLHMF